MTPAPAQLTVGILGPVEVTRGDVDVPITGGRVRALLARLALGYGRAVSSADLVDAIWGDAPPADVANALQTLASRLRRALGDANAVLPVPSGYRLAVRPEDVDAHRFSADVRTGRALLQAGRADAAASTLATALALWRDDPLVDLDPLPPAADELRELHLGALEDRIDADIRRGRAADVVAELESLKARHPLRERVTVLLMQALAGAGRPAEALRVYERLRGYLAEELGSDPSAATRQVHLQILRATNEPVEAAEPVPDPVAPRHRTNLRAQRTTFLGRDDEAKRIAGLLDGSRLVSIIGPGGAGKTRLAGVVAAGLVERMDDGVWLVELAPVTDEAAIAQAVLSSLGVRAAKVLERNQDRPAASPTERLLDLLSESECLMVIDNCEHLITAVAELVDQLLARCPDLTILTTSREPLGIDGEALCLLPPLGLPPVDVGADEVLAWPAAALFADRAAAVSAGFVITEDSVGDVVEIVRRLDGLPLAIELAAARLRVMPVAEIARRLSDRFRLLTGGSRTAMPRHRTLRAVVEWSWELLTPAEQRLAERLAIFPSGATVDSAIAVCADDRLPTESIPDLLNNLVDKSLLQVSDAAGLRYRMLETIREYGTEQLAERGEMIAVRTAHAHYFAELVAEADRWIRTSEQLPWLRQLQGERDNILAALRFLGESGDARVTIDMVLQLGMYWTLLGTHVEAANWMRFALEVEGPVDPHRRAMIEGIAAMNLLIVSYSEDSAGDFATDPESLNVIAAKLADIADQDEPLIVFLRPMLAFFADDHEQMFELIEEGLRVGDPWVRAALVMFRASMAENLGDVEQMRIDTETALREFTELGERWGLASALSSQGQLYALDGDIDRAITAFDQAIGYLADFGATSDEAYMHLRLANLYLRRQDVEAARREADLVGTTDVHVGSRAQRLMADTAHASIARISNDREALRHYRRTLDRQLSALGPGHPLSGHLRAMALATLSVIAVDLGDTEAVQPFMAQAYDAAIGTQDRPIMAMVAGAIAYGVASRGQFADAATILGAADRLRGIADPTDPDGAALIARLTEQLGEQFQTYYRAGFDLDSAAALERAAPPPL